MCVRVKISVHIHICVCDCVVCVCSERIHTIMYINHAFQEIL